MFRSRRRFEGMGGDSLAYSVEYVRKRPVLQPLAPFDVEQFIGRISAPQAISWGFCGPATE
jgi:hypothetical protein